MLWTAEIKKLRRVIPGGAFCMRYLWYAMFVYGMPCLFMVCHAYLWYAMLILCCAYFGVEKPRESCYDGTS